MSKRLHFTWEELSDDDVDEPMMEGSKDEFSDVDVDKDEDDIDSITDAIGA